MIILEILVLKPNGQNEYMTFWFDEYDHAKEFASLYIKTFRLVNNERAKILYHTIRFADRDGADLKMESATRFTSGTNLRIVDNNLCCSLFISRFLKKM